MKSVIAYNIDKGRPVLWSIGATAGNVTKTLTPGTNNKIKILYGFITLTTDATVANRYIYVKITTSTPADMVVLASAGPRAASGSFTWSLLPSPFVTTAGLGVDQYTGLGGLELFGTDILDITIIGGVAGDSYSGKIKYLKTRLG